MPLVVVALPLKIVVDGEQPVVRVVSIALFARPAVAPLRKILQVHAPEMEPETALLTSQ